MSGGHNTSQDPNYVGPTGFEKAVHKTRFTVPRAIYKGEIETGYVWIEIRPNLWKLVPKADAEKDVEGVTDGNKT